MKKYERVAHISIGKEKSSEFTDMIAARIDEYQIDGLEVEVQYQCSILGYSAIILGYKEDGE